MAQDITLEDYLKNDPSVKQAKKVLDEAEKSLTGARNVTPDVLRELQAIKAQALQSYNSVVDQTTSYFKTNFIGISTAGISDSITKLEEAKKSAPNQDTIESIQISIDKLKEKQKNPQSYKEPVAPKPKQKIKKDKNGKIVEEKTSTVDIDSFTKDIEKAGNYIANLDDNGRKVLAQQLNTAYGLKLPVDGKYSPDLKTAYLQALSDNLIRSLDFNRKIPFTEFLVVAGKEGVYKPISASEPTFSGTISNETEARALINTAFKSELGRDATTTEIKKLTKELNTAEKKNPFKTVKGIKTGGLNKEQFLKDAIVKLPEFAKKKEDTRSLSVQTLQSTARANGVSLSPEQLNQYALEIQNGKDVKVIQNQIRQIAGAGMPDNVKKLLAEGTDLDTVYAPYKTQMAAILEINPQTINFTDPALRSAIGPSGEMSIYDFQRALRKDARWQYTNNAREDVFQSVGKVLQDFGFQG